MATDGYQDISRRRSEDGAVGGRLPVTCVPCVRSQRTTAATVVCSKCDVNLCGDCCQGHRIHVPGEHIFVSIQSGKEEHCTVDLRGLDRCSVHGRVFVYLCNDHGCLCCEDCQFHEHRNCRVVNKISQLTASADDSGSRSETATELRVILSTVKDVIESCQTREQKHEEERTDILREFDRMKSDIIGRFEEAKARLEDELNAFVEVDKTELAEIKNGANSIQTNIQKLLSLHELVRNNGTETDKFILNFTSNQCLLTAKETKYNDDTVFHKLKWSQQILDILNADISLVALLETKQLSDIDSSALNDDTAVDVIIEEFNNTSIETCQDDPNIKTNKPTTKEPQTTALGPELGDTAPRHVIPKTIGIEHETAEMVPTLGDDALRPARLTLLQTYKLTSVVGATGLAFMPDGRIAAVDPSHDKCACFLLSPSLQMLGSPYRFQKQPHDVTCYQENNIAVTLGNSIALLDVSRENNITLLKTLSTSFNCDSICLLDADTFLVSTYGHQNPVRTITVQGMEGELQHAGLPFTVSGFNEGACAYIPSSKTLLFSNCSNDTVFVCDNVSGTCREIKDRRIRSPRSVCAGPHGSSFVCSTVTQTVVQLSPDGEVVTSHEVDMLPLAVSVSNDGTRMVVSEWTCPQEIKLFSMEY